MEQAFHNQFYNFLSELRFTDVSHMEQKVGETTSQFLNRFKLVRMRCNAKVLKEEYVEATIMRMRNFEAVNHFKRKTSRDLGEFINSVCQFERIQERQAKLKVGNT